MHFLGVVVQLVLTDDAQISLDPTWKIATNFCKKFYSIFSKNTGEIVNMVKWSVESLRPLTESGTARGQANAE